MGYTPEPLTSSFLPAPPPGRPLSRLFLCFFPAMIVTSRNTAMHVGFQSVVEELRQERSMARYTGPKFKLSRREGVNVTGTTSPRLQQVINIPPGGVRRTKRRPTDFAELLRAKQRVKAQYGLQERQFRRVVEEAERLRGSTPENLLKLLERRLDNVVYRLGWGRTRPMARQLVSHGHVEVNGRRVNIPSYRVKYRDVVHLRASAAGRPAIQEEMLTRGVTASWLERDTDTARVTGSPRREDVDADIREVQVVEFYSR